MADFDKSKFDPQAAAEARKQEMDQMAEKLEAGVKDVFQGDNYKAYLDFCARMPRYSINNQILIMMQKPDATMCQSFTGWKEMGRFVKKGEKGIRVMAPSPYKIERERDKLDGNGKPILDADGEPIKEKVEVKITAFKPVSTFDISQTEGEPVPTLGVDELTGSVEGYETLMEAIKQASPVPISFENIETGAKGYFQVEENRIVIQEGMSEAQTVKTALHEASHATLHNKEAQKADSDKKSRCQKECEAESVAYVVCQHYGVDTAEYSFPYVAGWSSDKEVPELKASLDTIRRAASELIVKIDEKVAEITQDRNQNRFADIEQWMEAHGEELPFDNPGADLPVGYIEITPPVDISGMKTDKPIKVSMEEPEQDIKEKAEKKKSVKKQISEKKEKSARTAKPKKNATKGLEEAI